MLQESLSEATFAKAFDSLLLLEASIVIADLTERLMTEFFARPEAFDSVEFRAFAKRFARRCTAEQAEAMLAAMSPSIKEIAEGEGAYVLMALFTAKPQLRMETFETQNEHALKLFSTLQ